MPSLPSVCANGRPARPKYGWDSVTTSESLRFAEAMMLGKMMTLHHPHCPSLRPQHSLCYYNHVKAVPATYGNTKGFKVAMPGVDVCCGHYFKKLEPRTIH